MDAAYCNNIDEDKIYLFDFSTVQNVKNEMVIVRMLHIPLYSVPFLKKWASSLRAIFWYKCTVKM